MMTLYKIIITKLGTLLSRDGSLAKGVALRLSPL